MYFPIYILKNALHKSPWRQNEAKWVVLGRLFNQETQLHDCHPMECLDMSQKLRLMIGFKWNNWSNALAVAIVMSIHESDQIFSILDQQHKAEV